MDTRFTHRPRTRSGHGPAILFVREPGDLRSWQVCVLHQPGGRGGSTRIHHDVREGEGIPVRGPRHNFPLVEASQHLFIAGGIGITPFLSMVTSVHEAGADWSLTYGGHSR